MDRLSLKNAALVGLWFGGLSGADAPDRLLSGRFSLSAPYSLSIIGSPFVLLVFIGGKMIWESFSCEEEKVSGSLGFKTMLVMAVATSIDALATGVTFAFFSVNIYFAVPFIGVITFLLSALGVKARQRLRRPLQGLGGACRRRHPHPFGGRISCWSIWAF